MTVDGRRYVVIAVLIVGAVVSPFSHDAGLAVFVVAAALFVWWRRSAIAARRAKVFDREAKTFETGTRTDR